MEYQYKEEEYSAKLFWALLDRFASASPPVNVERLGATVHWRCVAERDPVSCLVHCVATLREKNPEFHAKYKRGEEIIAHSCNPSIENTVAAVGSWLQHGDLDLLYQQFAFVDREKRALQDLAVQLKTLCPALEQSASSEFKARRETHILRFSAGSRAVSIYFWGKDIPDARFFWDDSKMFQFEVRNDATLATIVHEWLCENAMPSALRSRHPWLNIGQLADYYEAGNPTEGEFIQSWEGLSGFFAHVLRDDPCREQVVAFLKKLIDAGYNKTLRAGTFMRAFVLSRCQRHGLESGQSYIAFQFFDTNMAVSYGRYPTNSPGLVMSAIDLTEEVETLLKKLESEPVS